MLIIRLDAIGDAVTTVPLVAALRRYGIRVGIVLRSVNAQVFAKGALDAIHIHGPDGVAAAEIRDHHYEVALIVTEKPIAYRIARRARIPSRIGFENGWGKPLKTLWVRSMCTQTIYRSAGLDPRAPHECEVVFRLAQPFLPEAQPSREVHVLRPLLLERAPAPDARVAIQLTDKWERLGAHPHAVVALVKQIASRHSIRLIGAASEAAYCRAIAAHAGAPVEMFDALGPWKAAIASARALVAPDSGAVHVAGMVGTPVVACFAAAHFGLQTARWAPWAAAYRTVQVAENDWPTVTEDALAPLLHGTPGHAYKG